MQPCVWWRNRSSTPCRRGGWWKRLLVAACRRLAPDEPLTIHHVPAPGSSLVPAVAAALAGGRVVARASGETGGVPLFVGATGERSGQHRPVECRPGPGRVPLAFPHPVHRRPGPPTVRRE